MTVEDAEVVEPVVAKPRPVRRPPARAKPAPRAPGQSETITLTRADLKDLVADAVAPFQARLEQVERNNTMQYIESEPPPKPVIREADPALLSPFTRKLSARTHAVPEHFDPNPEPAYNVPLRWFYKPDNDGGVGDYVQLQGDAKSRALYEDLGFALLTLEETADFLKNERPKIVQEQQTRAALINGLRQLVKREAVLSGYIDDMKWDMKLDSSTIDDLEEEWHNLCRQTNNPDRRLPVAERYREERDPLLTGVETSRSTSLEDLRRKLSADGSHARTVATEFEVTAANAHMFA